MAYLRNWQDTRLREPNPERCASSEAAGGAVGRHADLRRTFRADRDRLCGKVRVQRVACADFGTGGIIPDFFVRSRAGGRNDDGADRAGPVRAELYGGLLPLSVLSFAAYEALVLALYRNYSMNEFVHLGLICLSLGVLCGVLAAGPDLVCGQTRVRCLSEAGGRPSGVSGRFDRAACAHTFMSIADYAARGSLACGGGAGMRGCGGAGGTAAGSSLSSGFPSGLGWPHMGDSLMGRKWADLLVRVDALVACRP